VNVIIKNIVTNIVKEENKQDTSKLRCHMFSKTKRNKKQKQQLQQK